MRGSTVSYGALHTACPRLSLPPGTVPDLFREFWETETFLLESRKLLFLDTFEWGNWYEGHILYASGDYYHLCLDDNGWPGALVCREGGDGKRRFWQDFNSPEMRASLEGMMGLRALSTVAEASFRTYRTELRNELGKIVCRVEWVAVYAGRDSETEIQHSCRIIPLKGYEREAGLVAERLTAQGAAPDKDGPMNTLFRLYGSAPRKYSLRPSFGIEPETTARDAAGRIVRGMLEIIAMNLPGLIDDLDTEFLHDYRICIRKIRSALGLLKGVYPVEECSGIREELGNMARQTNRLRDLDVYLLARTEYLELLPAPLRPAMEEMFEDFAAERKMEVRKVVTKIRSRTARNHLERIERFFCPESRHEESPNADVSVSPLVFRQIYRRYKKIRKASKGLSPETPDAVFHQIRIECKKLRYLMEFFSEIIPQESGDILQKQLRRLQGRLGDFNDASVQQKALLDYWNRKKPGPRLSLGLGGLISLLYNRQLQTRGLVIQALDEFCGASTSAAFKRTFWQQAAAF